MSDRGGAPAAAWSPVTLRDGAVVVLRAAVPADDPLVAAFHAGLSSRSVYQRYFHQATLDERNHQQRLAVGESVDAARGATLVAEHRTADGRPEVLAVGRLQRATPDDAEIAVVVADRVHGQGLGTAMTRALIAVARRLGVRRLSGDMFADNDAMRAVVTRTGFTVRRVPGDARLLRAERLVDADATAG
ncbi:MAG: GNAT family N-acetyltransferase [Vicinamibacterales bacterium]